MISNLPNGTVTFLFTDIEGSTKLAQQFPNAMPALLARHHEILHQAIHAHNGYVFQLVGDSFAVAFHSASDALNAALEAQRVLQKEAWDPAPVFVRMGIHTGAAELLEGGSKEIKYSAYAAIATSQRIMSVGHGGQLLLSQTARDLVRDRLPEQAELRDMGECRLKDVLEPQRLYQLVVPDLLADFAPLNTLETFTNNLPTQLTSFIGRQDEINAVTNLLAEHRMVTPTGSGGCGKTRLALEVANHVQANFTDGTWFIELAPIADPALVPQTVIATLNLRQDSVRSGLQVLTDYLRMRNSLLILDNCEHLIESCAQLCEALLRGCPKLKIIATSREALGIGGETPYRVPSLKTASPEHLPPLETLATLDSIRLFLDRAAVAKSDFRLTPENARFIAQICYRLDGIPLAIELAAARVKVLSPEQIAGRLDDRFRLLTGGSRTALPRQQTLRAMIDWSYSLLSEAEKVLFRRLAVFAGGWTMEAAEQVCDDEHGGMEILDLLTRLVDKSLVITEEVAGETRYHRLETIRQYSREKFFETAEVEALRNRHLAYYVQFSEYAEKEIQRRERFLWVQRLKAELDNVRAAMAWGFEKNPDSALKIAASMIHFWTVGGYSSAEGFRWLKNLEHFQANTPEQSLLRAKALCGLSFIYMSLGNNLNAKRLAEESIALYRQSENTEGLAFALRVYAMPLESLGERAQAETALKESLALARIENNDYIVASVLNILARVTIDLYGDVATALQYTEQALRISQEAGIEYTAALAYEIKGVIAVHSGEYETARALFEKAERDFEQVGADFNVLLTKANLAHLERQHGNPQRAFEIYCATIVAFRDVGQIGAVAHQLECFGFLALAQAQYARALQLFAAANALREKGSMLMTPDEQVYFDEQLKIGHEQLGEAEFKKAWESGRAMNMDRAIAYAIGA